MTKLKNHMQAHQVMGYEFRSHKMQYPIQILKTGLNC